MIVARNLRENDLAFLRAAPVIGHRHLLHAADGARRSAGFCCPEFPPDVIERVFGQRSAGITALLGTVVDEAVFADVQVPGPRAAVPVVWPSLGEILLEPVQAGISAAAVTANLTIDAFFPVGKRLQLTGTVVDDSERCGKTQLLRHVRDQQGVLRRLDPAADHGIDVHVEFGVFGEELELLAQNLQALDRNLVRLHVIDADLQMVEPRVVQSPDFIRDEKIAVRDDAGDHVVMADPGNDGLDIRVQQGLPAADRDDFGSQLCQFVDSGADFPSRHRGGEIVVLVAVGARQVTSTHRDDMGQHCVAGRKQTPGHHPKFPQPQLNFLLSIHGQTDGETIPNNKIARSTR